MWSGWAEVEQKRGLLSSSHAGRLPTHRRNSRVARSNHSTAPARRLTVGGKPAKAVELKAGLLRGSADSARSPAASRGSLRGGVCSAPCPLPLLAPLVPAPVPRPSAACSRRTLLLASSGGRATMQASEAAASSAWQASVTNPMASRPAAGLGSAGPPPSACRPRAASSSASALPSISRTAAALARAAFSRTRPKPCRARGQQEQDERVRPNSCPTTPALQRCGNGRNRPCLQDPRSRHAEQLQRDGG